MFVFLGRVAVTTLTINRMFDQHFAWPKEEQETRHKKTAIQTDSGVHIFLRFSQVLVAGAGFEPRGMHKQNCFQLPQAGMALPDHDYIIVRFDVANTSGAVNDARH